MTDLTNGPKVYCPSCLSSGEITDGLGGGIDGDLRCLACGHMWTEQRDLTNEALNEAVALALGLPGGPCPSIEKPWNHTCWKHRSGFQHRSWVTDAQACLDDLSPVVRQVWPEGHWSFSEAHGVWVVVFYCEYRDRQWRTVNASAPTLARAICKVFMEVMK